MRRSRRLTSVASVSGGAPAAVNSFDQAFLGEALAVARFGEEVVLDHLPHAGRLVGQRALVELSEDRFARSGEQVGGNLVATLRDPRVVELAADEGQERRLDLGIGEFGAAGDEADDRRGDFLGDELAARIYHRGERLRAGHPGEPHPVLGDRGHLALEPFEVGEIVLAQRDQDPVVGARKVEFFRRRVVALDALLELPGRAVLNEVGEVVQELGGALAAEIVALRQREDLLELVEDQQRGERLPGRVAQHVVAVVQELPQRFAADRGAGLRPLPRRLRLAEDRLLDLLGRWRRVGRVIDRARRPGSSPRAAASARCRRAGLRSCRARTGRTGSSAACAGRGVRVRRFRRRGREIRRAFPR